MNALSRRLGAAVELSSQDYAALERAVSDVRLYGKNVEIVAQGARVGRMHVMLDGWACRSKSFDAGQRQITAVMLPGDMCDLHCLVQARIDHTITTLTPSRVAHVSLDRMRELVAHSEAMHRALMWNSLVNETILREWLISVGRRTAERRIAHLMCELHARLEVVGLVEGENFALPLTQQALADVLGLSVVHLNRCLQTLRCDGLVMIEGRRARLDLARAREYCGFDAAYLELLPDQVAEPAQRLRTNTVPAE